jgi:type IV pilus assembly protein PilA
LNCWLSSLLLVSLPLSPCLRFLNQANKAKQSEAKTYVGSINRAQQAIFLENNAYTDDIADLQIGIRSITENYRYEISTVPNQSTQAYVTAMPSNATRDATGAFTSVTYDTDSTLKAYLGIQGIGVTDPNNSLQSEQTTLAVVCEALEAPARGGEGASGRTAQPTTYNTTTGPTCPNTFRAL